MRLPTNNPAPRITVKAAITDRSDPYHLRREIKVDKTESCKLPKNDYPVTLGTNSEGLPVQITDVRSHARC